MATASHHTHTHTRGHTHTHTHTKKKHCIISCLQEWKEWRLDEIHRDLKYAHPRWPEEEQYLVQEMDEIDKLQPNYFNDFW